MLWSSLDVHERRRHFLGDVARHTGRRVEHIEVLGVVVEILLGIGRRGVAPSQILLDHRLLAGLRVDRVDVTEALPVEVAHQLVGLVAGADGPLAASGDLDVRHFFVCDADHHVLANAIHGHVVEGPVLVLLDALLRLQARILVVPHDEVRTFVASGAATGATRSGIAAFRRGAFSRRGIAAAGTGRHLGQLGDAEDQRAAILGPDGRAVAADRHLGRERLVRLRVVDHLLRCAAAEAGESHHGVETLAIGAVIGALQHRDRVAFLRPGHALVERLVGIERRDRSQRTCHESAARCRPDPPHR